MSVLLIRIVLDFDVFLAIRIV